MDKTTIESAIRRIAENKQRIKMLEALIDRDEKSIGLNVGESVSLDNGRYNLTYKDETVYMGVSADKVKALPNWEADFGEVKYRKASLVFTDRTDKDAIAEYYKDVLDEFSEFINAK